VPPPDRAIDRQHGGQIVLGHRARRVYIRHLTFFLPYSQHIIEITVAYGQGRFLAVALIVAHGPIGRHNVCTRCVSDGR